MEPRLRESRTIEATGDGPLLCKTFMPFVGMEENELCYALLLVKWRKLIELYSSHKGNCF